GERAADAAPQGDRQPRPADRELALPAVVDEQDRLPGLAAVVGLLPPPVDRPGRDPGEHHPLPGVVLGEDHLAAGPLAGEEQVGAAAVDPGLPPLASGEDRDAVAGERPERTLAGEALVDDAAAVRGGDLVLPGAFHPLVLDQRADGEVPLADPEVELVVAAGGRGGEEESEHGPPLARGGSLRLERSDRAGTDAPLPPGQRALEF